MKFGFFLGCQIPFLKPEVEASIRKVMSALGVELIDLEGYSCCPTWMSVPSLDLNAWLSISARNLAIAENLGVDVVTGCNNCFSVLNHARYLLKDEKRKFEVNRILSKFGKFYRGTSKVYHVIHVLSDFVEQKELKKKVVHPLKDLTVAIHPGCQLLWPTRIMDVKEENPFYPEKLKNLVEMLGAKAPYYSRLDYCCGAGTSVAYIDYEKSSYFVLTKLESMKEEIEPDLIVTPCSTCLIQIEEMQKKLKKDGKINFEIPVVYYTQLLAICMGIPANEVFREESAKIILEVIR